MSADVYNSHPSGVRCIEIVGHMGFNLGSVIKNVWAAEFGESSGLEELRTARYYLEQEIQRLSTDGRSD